MFEMRKQGPPSPQDIFKLQMDAQKAIIAREPQFNELKKRFLVLVVDTADLYNQVAMETSKTKIVTPGMIAEAVKQALESFKDLARNDDVIFQEAIDIVFRRNAERIPNEKDKEVLLQQGKP